MIKKYDSSKQLKGIDVITGGLWIQQLGGVDAATKGYGCSNWAVW